MMSTPVRWGLLGTARINRRLVPAIRATRRSVLAAVASRNRARAEAYASEWQVPTAHGSYDALLRDPAVDAIYIPLPNALHVEWTLRALDAGKHVLCEKPLALSPHDVDRIAAMARAHGRVVAEALMYRHEPLFAQMAELVRNDAIGEVRVINTGFTFEQSGEGDIRLNPALGGGSLWDVGCYPVSAAIGLLDQTPVEAFGWATRSGAGVDQAFSGLLRFATGAVATIHSSFRAAYHTWFDVHGAGGSMRIAHPFRPELREEIIVVRGDQVETVPVDGSSLLFVRQVEDFVAAVLDGRPQAVALSDSRRIAASLAALYRSADEAQPVQL